MSREAFNKFCFTSDITPSTEHLDIWKVACDYQRESDASLDVPALDELKVTCRIGTYRDAILANKEP